MVELDNVVIVDKDKFKQLEKDRLDFGFDSIYFRYAEAIDEITMLKTLYQKGGYDPETLKRQANSRKMHFYNTLEQLLHAHEENK